MATINTLMRAAQEATTGLNDFFYNDPYNVTANGASPNYPAVFRLLRTDDTIVSTNLSDKVTQNEYLVFAKPVDKSEGMEDEEATENELTTLAFTFLSELKKQGVKFTINPNLKWGRRDLPSYALVLIVRIAIENAVTITSDCVTLNYNADPTPTDEC